MINSISILGSTGSIGKQTIAVAQHLNLPVRALAAWHNITLLEQQARLLHPTLVAVYDVGKAKELAIALADTDIRVVGGAAGLKEAAVVPGADCVVTAVSGAVGLEPTLAAIRAGRRIALANKETLVCAGEIVMALAAKLQVEILPVDSEHSAIFQSLQGRRAELRRILLTASGGPFRGRSRESLRDVTPQQAVSHPNWSMGAKISVDSATLMNKGLELIEAMHLFSCTPDMIEVLVHPESVVHSGVEFVDGSVIAQLGVPDMGLPIQYALTWPTRTPGRAASLDLFQVGTLHFEAPDVHSFPCLQVAMDCARSGGTAPAAMNAANEVAVARFLREEIGFLDIADCVAETVQSIDFTAAPGLGEILETDRAARAFAAAYPGSR